MDLISTRTIEFATLGLDGLSARHKAISSNIANADTPDYKRVDVTFEDQLSKIINTEDLKENQRLTNSMGTDNTIDNLLSNNQPKAPLSVNYNESFMKMSDFNPQTVESNENAPNTNGNTVNIEQEMSSLTKNGMSYNALANLQSREFKSLAEVIRVGNV